MNINLTRYDNMEQILGNNDQRYLSCGYKNVLYQLNNIYIYPTRNTLSGEAKVTYPNNWSVKKENSNLVPHLSTLDGILVSFYANSLYLSQIYQLDPLQRDNIWIKTMRIKSGNQPFHELNKIPVNTTFISTEKSSSDLYEYTSQFSNLIGNMQVDFEFGHSINGSNSRKQYLDSLKEVWHDMDKSYYGGLFKNTIHQLTDVIIDPEDQTLDSAVKIIHSNSDLGNPNNYPYYSVIDAFVCASQQMQALLYHVDKLERKNSNNLWMRKIIYKNTSPIRNVKEFRQTVKLGNCKVLNLNKCNWQTADFECNIQNSSGAFYLKVDLAHQLPESASSLLYGKH